MSLREHFCCTYIIAFIIFYCQVKITLVQPVFTLKNIKTKSAFNKNY